MPIYRLGERIPRVDPSAWVHESAVLIGAVVIGPRASVWPNAVLRADNEPIEVGEETNIQDGCVLHCDPGTPVRIGARVSVGHMAMLHGCVIGDDVLVGIQAVILNGAGIARGSVLGAGGLLTEGKQIPEDSVAVGSPAKIIRPTTPADLAMIRANAASYVRRGALFRAEMAKIPPLSRT